MVATAYSYIRMSTEVQLRGDSLRRQLEKSQKYAEAHGLALDDSLRDIGVSAFRGRNKKKGALRGFLDLVESGKIPPGTTLLVEHFDRLSREHVLEAHSLFLRLITSGIVVVTLVDGKEYSMKKCEASDLICSLSYMARAHEESQIKGERIAESWEARRKRIKDQPITTRCPAWLTFNRKTRKFEVVEERAAVVRRIFEESANGLGRYAIAKRLNTDAVPTFGRSKFWLGGAIQKFLESETAIGIFQPCRMQDGKRVPVGEPVEDYYPAVVTKELFYRSRRSIGERFHKSGPKGKRYSNLFQHLCICRECGSRMTFVDKRRSRSTGDLSRFYQCQFSLNGGACANNAKVPCNVLENAVLTGFIKEIDLGALIQSDDDKETRLRTRLSEIEITLKKKRKLADNLLEAFADSADLDLPKRKIAKMELEIKSLEKEHAELEDDLQQAVHNHESIVERQTKIQQLTDALAEADETEAYHLRATIAQALKRVIKRITCDKEGRITIHIDDTHSYIYTEFRGKRVWLDVHGASPSQQGPGKFVPLIDS